MTRPAGRAEAHFRRVVLHRRWIATFGALFIGALGAYAAGVPIDYTMEQFFPATGAARETYDEFKGHFSTEDAQFTLFWEDRRPMGVELFAELRAAADLFEEEGLTGVRWFGNVEVSETLDLDGEPATRIYRLVDEAPLTGSAVVGVLDRQRNNELFRGSLWNPEQTVFSIRGHLPDEIDTDERRREVTRALSEAFDRPEGADAKLTLAGIPVFRSGIQTMLREDQRLFVVGGFLVFFAILLFFFRHVGHAALCLVSVLPAYLCTVALMGVTGGSVSTLTTFIPIIVLVVGVSDAIHLLARYRHVRAEMGDSDEAIVQAFAQLARACFYTSLTTAIGFLSLVGTRIDVVMEFGLFTAVAIMLTYGFSMTLLPALLGFSSRLTTDDRALRAGWIRSVVGAAIRLPQKRAVGALVVFSVVSVAAAAVGSTLRVNTFLLDDLRSNSPLIQDLRGLESAGFGVFQVNLLLTAEEDGQLHDPDMLRWMADFESFARSQAVVVNAVGLPDLLTELRRAVVDAQEPGLPESAEEAAQLLFLAELGGADDVGDVYLRDERVARVILTVRDEGSVVMLPILQAIERYVDDNPPPYGLARVTGAVPMGQTYATRLVQTFAPSLALAIVLVLGVMIHMFRSVKWGLIALAPNLFPLLVLMAAMKLAGAELKPSTILVFSIAFGLAVDDTMHLLSRLRDDLMQGRAVVPAIEESLWHTGPAILMTSIAMSAGFLLLMGSGFQVLLLVGVMTSVSIVAAILADFFALPSLLRIVGREYSAELSAQTAQAEP
ncbi:MAG TPA: MMPL family transporter [Longimicrobiales bacterium]|nr:MMPL family transporter [Longimicrobiales bacterium]